MTCAYTVHNIINNPQLQCYYEVTFLMYYKLPCRKRTYSQRDVFTLPTNWTEDLGHSTKSQEVMITDVSILYYAC